MMNDKRIKAVFLVALFLMSSIYSFYEIATTNHTVSNGNSDSNNNLSNIDQKLPSNAAEANNFVWWNLSWSFRVGININAQSDITYTDKLVSETFNFTALLYNDSQVGYIFDENSIRVIEYYSNGTILGETPSQFEQESGYNDATNALGDVFWVLNGTTLSGTTRYYFVYFDIIRDGPKEAPDYQTGLELEQNTYQQDYTMENNRILISMCEGSPPNGGSLYNHIYQVVDKETGIDQQRSGCHWGWALSSWNYGSSSGTFDPNVQLNVVYNGSVMVCVKMVWNYYYRTYYYPYTTYKFLFERYYLINYLDNSIEIRNTITNTGSSTLSQSHSSSYSWNFVSWWNPGRGDDNYNTPNSAYGLGGYNFSDPNTIFDGSNDFTSNPELYPNDLNGTEPMNATMRSAAWFVDWDESLGQGVGTIWNASDSDVTQWGYRSGTNQEGRDIYLYLSLPDLYSGQTREFDIWGIIFNSNNGTYIKDRAKGMQNDPYMGSVGPTQDSGKILTYHISDLDDSPIKNAMIVIWNSTSPNPMENLTTDSNGNVTFHGLLNGEYNITAYYKINTTVYTIDDKLNYTVNQPKYQRYCFLSVIGNLTTVTFHVQDSSINQPLNNATVIISNSSTLTEVISDNTAIDGNISFYLIKSNFSVSVIFQGSQRYIQIDGNTPAYYQNFSVELNMSITLNVSITEFLTSLSVVSTQFAQTSIWQHFVDFSKYPYNITMFRGDSVNLTTFYDNIKGGENSGISSASSSWSLINQSNGSLNSNGVLYDSGNGNYSVNIDSNQQNMTTGNYVLYITLSETNYESATLPILINILAHQANVTYIKSNSSDNVVWGQNLSLYIQYSEISPGNDNISSANIIYSLDENNSIKGSFIETQPGSGIYWMELNSSILSVQSYTFNIYASKENYTSESKIIPVSINAIPTNMSWAIPQKDKASNFLMKVAYGENISFYINYADASGKYIPNANVFIYLNDTDIFTTENMNNGSYLCQFNSTMYNPSLSEIKIDAFDIHHLRQTQNFELEILNYWNTQIDLIAPPSIYPWGNNASFIFRYFCNEQPRYNLNLPNGNINHLNITIKTGSIYQQFLNLGISSLGLLWGYQDLKSTSYGSGYYMVWFLTNTLNIQNNSVFYVGLNISAQYYRPSQYQPYVWVMPPQTALTPFAAGYGSKSVEKINLYLDQQIMIRIFFNVTDTESVLYGNYLRNAHVSYIISSFTNPNVILSSGELNNGNMTGEYTMLLNAIRIGDFKISFTAQLQNYSTAIATVELTVNRKIMNFTLGSNIIGGVITDPQNKEFTVDLNLIDPIFNTTLNNANISFIFNGVKQQFSAIGTGGTYSYTFTPALLAQVKADNSYVISIVIQMTNYTTVEIPLTVHVGFPVDPYLNIPYRYWLIFLGTTIAMVVVYGITKGVMYSRIPEIIKQINGTMKIIKKKKRVSGNKLRPLRDAIIADRLNGYWNKIGVKYPKSKETARSERLTFLNSDLHGLKGGTGGA